MSTMTPTLKMACFLALLAFLALVTSAANAQATFQASVASQESPGATISCEGNTCTSETTKALGSAVTEVVSQIPSRTNSTLQFQGHEIRIDYEDRLYVVSGSPAQDTTFTNVAQTRGYLREVLDRYLGVKR